MRGYITAHFLNELEKRAKRPLYELFDLVVGTSTGGVLAALIAAGIPAGEMLDFYRMDGPKIFKRTRRRLFKTFFCGSRYDNRALIECLTARIPPSITVGSAKTAFMVPTWDGNGDDNVYIKSFDRQKYWETFPLAYAAIATASAPTYFPGFVPGRYGWYDKYNSRFFDGGFIENNPVTCTLHEIHAVYEPALTFQSGPQTVINFGTGVVSIRRKGAPDGGRLLWANQVYPRMARSQSKLSERTAHRLFRNAEFFRVDVELDEPIRLDDAAPSTLRKMEDLANKAIDARSADGKLKNDFTELALRLKTN